jgi:hypothetical protein
MDKITPYDENKPLRTGCYYVETDQYFPMRGVGCYSLPIIEYCLESKLINHKNIKYSIKSILSIPSTYYNEFIDLCYKSLNKHEDIINFYNELEIDDSNIDFKKMDGTLAKGLAGAYFGEKDQIALKDKAVE